MMWIGNIPNGKELMIWEYFREYSRGQEILGIYGNLWELKGIYKSALKIIKIDQSQSHFTLI